MFPCRSSVLDAVVQEKCPFFLAVKDKMIALARNCGVFKAAERTIKKRHPRKDVSVKLLSISGLLIKRSSNVNGTSNSTTYHWVVTDSEESHHLNVCWNRRQTECNQTCLNCRGAKEEKPAGLN